VDSDRHFKPADRRTQRPARRVGRARPAHSAEPHLASRWPPQAMAMPSCAFSGAPLACRSRSCQFGGPNLVPNPATTTPLLHPRIRLCVSVPLSHSPLMSPTPPRQPGGRRETLRGPPRRPFPRPGQTALPANRLGPRRNNGAGHSKVPPSPDAVDAQHSRPGSASRCPRLPMSASLLRQPDSRRRPRGASAAAGLLAQASPRRSPDSVWTRKPRSSCAADRHRAPKFSRRPDAVDPGNRGARPEQQSTHPSAPPTPPHVHIDRNRRVPASSRPTSVAGPQRARTPPHGARPPDHSPLQSRYRQGRRLPHQTGRRWPDAPPIEAICLPFVGLRFRHSRRVATAPACATLLLMRHLPTGQPRRRSPALLRLHAICLTLR